MTSAMFGIEVRPFQGRVPNAVERRVSPDAIEFVPFGDALCGRRFHPTLLNFVPFRNADYDVRNKRNPRSEP